MTDLLYVIGSPRKGSSESSAIADAYLTEFRQTNPDAVIDVLDCGRRAPWPSTPTGPQPR